ncbi:hypothetical protein JR316_0009097 [Psilocybe cubensis]|uniref:Uncharacterized protein n=2 Tax=Psilocybe cubensis TaxID=181762 RepID=A0A8H7XZ34_PSICU|nr:hypothetical protein JR316_0009097 [Psilocybe cubensis]KAH9478640.1 hypothetical protein JR316_0009097 [Psilocybe cubensis]
MDTTVSLAEEYKSLLLEDVFRVHDKRKKVYNHQERQRIEAFREQYMNAGSNRGRKEVVCSILPILFNYWVETGSRIVSQTEDFAQQEAKVRASSVRKLWCRQAIGADKLLKWIRNNWRSPKPTEAELTGHPKKRTTILWRTRKEDVYKEIATILGIDSVTAGTPGIFENRMKAMGNILARMSDTELKQLDLEGKALNSVEYTDEQKRVNADKHAFRKLDEASKRDWAEMGLMNITFVTRLTESGQLAVRVHDVISSTLGVSSTSFEDQKPAEVTQIKRLIGVYVRGLLNARNRAMDGGGNGDESGILMLDQDAQGFPKLPRDLEADKLNKRQLETLMGLYFSQHYSLATNGRSKHPPYDHIEKKQAAFISPEFRKVKKHRKGDEMVYSKYPDEEFRLDEPKRPIPPPKKSRRRGKPTKSKPTQAATQPPLRIEEMQGGSQLISFNSIDNSQIDPQLLGQDGRADFNHPQSALSSDPTTGLTHLQDTFADKDMLQPQIPDTQQFSLETGPVSNLDMNNPSFSHLPTFIYPPPERMEVNPVENIIPQRNIPAPISTTVNVPAQQPIPRPKPRPRRKPVTVEEIAQAEENRRLLEEARNIERDILTNGTAAAETSASQVRVNSPTESVQTTGKRKKRSEVEESLILSGKRVRRVRERTS